MLPTSISGWISLGIWTVLVAWSGLLVGRKNPKVADIAQQAADATKAGVDRLKS